MLVRLTFVLLLCGASALLVAQNANVDEAWRWAHFTTESGLPSDRVIQVVETSSGTPWVATSSGLAWFDGFRWRPVHTIQSSPQQSGIRILGVSGDSLLVTMPHMTFVDTGGIHELGFGGGIMAVPLGNDSIIGIRDESLYLFHEGTSTLFSPSVGLTRGKTMGLWRTGCASFWASTVTGLYRWDGIDWKCRLRSPSGPLSGMDLVENKEGNGLAAIEFPYDQRGLWEWNAHSEVRRIPQEKPDNIKTLDISPMGSDAIVVYRSDEMRERRDGRWQSVSFRNAGVRDILAVKYRQNGDLWLATEHGLFLFKRSLSRWTYWKHNLPDLRNSINEILKARDGSFWIATSDGIEVRRPDGTMKQIDRIGGLPLYIVTGLCQDSSGNIWVSSGSSFSGAYRWNGSTWEHFAVSEDSGGFFVHKIRTDRNGRLWFLGMGRFYPPVDRERQGVYVLENGNFKRWGDGHIPGGRAYSFASGSDGSYWFGTIAGLSRWKDSAWKQWRTEDGLRSNRIFTMAVDHENRLWFGDYTEVSGIGCIDGTDSVRYYSTADGLVNNMIWDVRVDAYDKVWVTTQGGLSSYDGKFWSTFDAESGLERLALWPVLPLEDAIYVGTSGSGVAILSREGTNSPAPVLTIENPIMESKSVLLRWRTFAYWGELEPGQVRTRYRLDNGSWSAWDWKHEINLPDLPAGVHRVQVQAAGISGTYDAAGAATDFVVPLPFYLRPLYLIPIGVLTSLVFVMLLMLVIRKRRHDLQLRKSEEKFRTLIETTASAVLMFREGKIIFANASAEALSGYSHQELLGMDFLSLVHQDHKEHVRGIEHASEDGRASTDRYECLFVTKQDVARWVDLTTGWIRVEGAPVRLATALDITDRKLAESKLKMLASELSNTEERERRRMASYLHDVIGQTLALCKIKVRRLQKSSQAGAVAESLTEIHQLVEQSIYNTQSLTFELCPPILYELSLEAAVEWLTERLHHQHGIRFTYSDDKIVCPLPSEIRVILFQAVREACVNAIKHADAREVAVSIRKPDTIMRIDVSDDGKGFAPSDKVITSGNGGYGLFNMRERITHLGGSVTITSNSPHGTCVSIEVPVTQNLEAAPS